MFCVGKVFVFLLQLVQFVVAQSQCLKLLELVAEQLVAGALFITAAAKSLQGLPGLPPALGGQLHLAGKILIAAVLIEQTPVRIEL